ncbi:intraflagellar transport protein 88 homolog isoform X2 [Eurosta solidaginis]|uniref:intraflagellar transport protein 88 homolog isoform X2 n=1 Tax=Eurosta solidaginis TaxID=178769 RepID=UPI003531240D
MNTSSSPNINIKTSANSTRQLFNSPGRLISAARPPTSLLFSHGNIASDVMGSDKFITARPSTAVRGVGYSTNSAKSTGNRFNQLFFEREKQQKLSYYNVDVDSKKQSSPHVKFKSLETKIANLLDCSIVLSANAVNATIDCNKSSSTLELKAALAEALNKAKEAFSLDRTLHQFRAQYNENVFHNFDLTFAVFFNLAEQYDRSDMHIEALNTYSIMTKNKMLPHVNQLKLNMGNMYYKMGLYSKAIKMYRMALDSVPHSSTQLRIKITQNIGILLVRLGQYMEAASSFDFIMAERADIRCGIHSLLCYYAMGDVEKIKSKFRDLCDVQPMEADNGWGLENNFIKVEQNIYGQELEKHVTDFLQRPREEKLLNEGTVNTVNVRQIDYPSDRSYVPKFLKCDELAAYINHRRSIYKRAVTMIVDLISPIIEENYNDGYNWCIDVIRTTHLAWMANELELNKALVYLRHNDVIQAIETLQAYEKKSEESMSANAIINLTFIYINLGHFDIAAHCLNQMNEIGILQTNAFALVNASIVDYERRIYGVSRAKLESALQINPDNFEANYNLGLIFLQENTKQLASARFKNVLTKMMVSQSVPHSHVYFQLAKLKDNSFILDTSSESVAIPAALESYLQVLGVLAAETDSQLLNKVASIYEHLQDLQEANQYYSEAYRINPSDINIASSIGFYYIKLQAMEKAIYYYERAVLANPNDPNLMLRVVSCFRNSYLPSKKYISLFEKIYNRFPESLACVHALVNVTKSYGLVYLNEKYSEEYTRLHKIQVERQADPLRKQHRLNADILNKDGQRSKDFAHIQQILLRPLLSPSMLCHPNNFVSL